jgi:hypothetical protein
MNILQSTHSFHIPVMGLSYTIDSPVKVAKFGINSVISIVEDRLIEMMRRHYHRVVNLEFKPIPESEPDYRAKRITAYLNLVNRLVKQQFEALKNSAFEAGSDIIRYFEMLPDNSHLKLLFKRMRETANQAEQFRLQDQLRALMVAGSIDVNIMTKTDKNNYHANGDIIEDGSDAIAALRGYINSDLTNSSIIFSAGMNPRLYNYLEKTDVFHPDENGNFKKKVVIKVSDYRSALIQGKYLAKKGIWVSEFRIESGLNCGGHAFATQGYLLGPILQEFVDKRKELIETMFSIYHPAMLQKELAVSDVPPNVLFSVQGGIGTASENQLLLDHFGIHSTGWGTPFLLVPEATTVDPHTLELLCRSTEEDVYLSKNSPLGVRFHYLKGTTADLEKQDRINKGRPGSPCTEKHLSFNTEFTETPICTASYKYQKLKIRQLKEMNLPENEYRKQYQDVVDKECLCVGLSNSAALLYNEEFVPTLKSVNVCPGPNIVNFSRIATLKEMTDHIYGRADIMTNSSRPHMFVAELKLYVDYLEEEIRQTTTADAKIISGWKTFCANLLSGISYYRTFGVKQIENFERFIEQLSFFENRITALMANLE